MRCATRADLVEGKYDRVEAGVTNAVGRLTISFGWVKVDDAPHGTVSHNWFGFRRAADGAVLLQSCTASMLGLFSWFLWLALVLAIVR